MTPVTETNDDAPVDGLRRARHRRAKRRSRATVASVFGELLLTIGLVMLLFVGWQHFFGDRIMGSMQNQHASEQLAQWGIDDVPADPTVELNTVDAPPIMDPVGDQEPMAVMYIPRFGSDFARTIGEGTSRYVLDALELGIAHYDTTQLPGEIGNFAVAAHRNGRGGPFTTLDELRVGDHIYVLTADTWYVYQFRNAEYVEPTAVEVISPVPHHPELPADDRYLTLTTCNPIGSIAGRLIGYAVFVGWQPAELGPPATLVAEQGGDL